MIERFYNATATLLRKTAGIDDDGNYEQTEAEICDFPCYKQQASPEMAQYFASTTSKTWTLWCAFNTPVHEDDRLRIGTDLFTVRAVQRNGDGENKHLELVLTHGGISN